MCDDRASLISGTQRDLRIRHKRYYLPEDSVKNQKRIVIHIGMPKTGTSFIQEALSVNDDHLRFLGIEYPKTGRVYGAHHSWIKVLAENNGVYAASPIEIEDVNAAIASFRSGTCDTLIISSEGLFSSVGPTSFLANLSSEFEVFAVAFLRHPIDYLNSILNQAQKMRIYEEWSHMLGPWGWKQHIPRLYSKSLSIWKQIVGSENLLVAAMDGTRDPLDMFINLVDDRLVAAKTIATSNGLNASLRPEALAYIEDYIHSPHERSNIEQSMISNILNDYSSLEAGSGAPPFHLVPPEAFKQIERSFGFDLKEVERQYLDKEAALMPRLKGEFVDILSVSHEDKARVSEYVVSRLAKHAEFLHHQLEACKAEAEKYLA